MCIQICNVKNVCKLIFVPYCEQRPISVCFNWCIKEYFHHFLAD